MRQAQTSLADQPSNDLQRRLARVLEPRQEILEAYLFGSHGRGEAGAMSDIDVAVYVDDRSPPLSPYGYEADLIAVRWSRFFGQFQGRAKVYSIG